jgi:hypothetical protein
MLRRCNERSRLGCRSGLDEPARDRSAVAGISDYHQCIRCRATSRAQPGSRLSAGLSAHPPGSRAPSRTLQPAAIPRLPLFPRHAAHATSRSNALHPHAVARATARPPFAPTDKTSTRNRDSRDACNGKRILSDALPWPRIESDRKNCRRSLPAHRGTCKELL